MKRYTDTEKWRDPWYRRLPPKLKAAWEYILDECDLAGVYDPDMQLLSFSVGAEVDEGEVFQSFNNGKTRLEKLPNDKWLVPHYVSAQWGGLHPSSQTHQKVLERIYYNGVQDKVVGRVPPKKKKQTSTQKKHNIYKRIIDDLNRVCGTKYRCTTRATQKQINARLREGFDVDDFKRVHRIKHKEWGSDGYWKQFLRPQTLYSNKFEAYLNQEEKSDFSEKYGG